MRNQRTSSASPAVEGRQGLSQAERTLRARIAAHVRWSREPDPTARTANGRAAFLARFEAEVDPDVDAFTAVLVVTALVLVMIASTVVPSRNFIASKPKRDTNFWQPVCGGGVISIIAEPILSREPAGKFSALMSKSTYN